MGVAPRFVEGRCAPDGTIVFRGRSANERKLESLRVSGSRVRWHSDNEGLFGDRGDPKLIVSLSIGFPAVMPVET